MSANDSGSVQLLADRKCSLRIYQRDNHPDGGSSEARVGLPVHLPAPIVEPGTIIGTLLPEIAGHSSLAGTPVIAPACHDTGSAVASISARDGTAFLSSGTWSLVGTELDSPVITSD